MKEAKHTSSPDWSAAGISEADVGIATKPAFASLRCSASTPSFIETVDGEIVAQVTERYDSQANENQRLAEMWLRASLLSTAPDHHTASQSTVSRLADLPSFLRRNGSNVLASMVEEELAKHAAAIAKAQAA